jgi:hypothetical protein
MIKSPAGKKEIVVKEKPSSSDLFVKSFSGAL